MALGLPVPNEDLVNLPNWLVLQLRIEAGEAVRLADARLLEYRHELNVQYATAVSASATGMATAIPGPRAPRSAPPHQFASRPRLWPRNAVSVDPLSSEHSHRRSSEGVPQTETGTQSGGYTRGCHRMADDAL